MKGLGALRNTQASGNLRNDYLQYTKAFFVQPKTARGCEPLKEAASLVVKLHQIVVAVESRIYDCAYVQCPGSVFPYIVS